jgi:hypothetical protein
MSYIIQNDWLRKDVLDSESAGKVISGSHFYNDFVAIQNEFVKKAEKAGSATQTFQALTPDAGENDNKVATTEYVTRAITEIYPIDSIFTTVANYADSAAVVTAIGGTTWVSFGAGKVLVGVDSTDTDFDIVDSSVGSLGGGGSKTHTLLEAEMPSHSHSVLRGNTSDTGQTTYLSNHGANSAGSPTSWDNGTGNSGGDVNDDTTPHNNIQPYLTVYFWRRTA